MIAANTTNKSFLILEVCWLRLLHITQGIVFITTENSSVSNLLLVLSSCGSGQSILRR